MAYPLYVAFIWHQHQPLYRSQINFPGGASPGKYHLPWVRLHGVKDYLDMVLRLARYPRLHQTVNLVPSLVLQLQDYIQGEAFDPYLALALTPTENLSRDNKAYILRYFFDANAQRMIAPHPRYRELYERRQEEGVDKCLETWGEEDYGDLLAWHNLAWFDPLFWDDPQISTWLEQGCGFTLSDRQRIYSKQRQILAQILPYHRQLQDTGQLEVTTSPYTHPILPLLADTDAGRVAVPRLSLPAQRFHWPEDIGRHLQRSWQLYQKWFGCDPRGLWPSEQAVSSAILPYVARQGFKWLCSDEMILGQSLGHLFQRDPRGNLYTPEVLYQPYRLTTKAGDLAIVFRDHRLSDLIGFTYGSMPPAQAAADLVHHLEEISYSLQARQGTASLDRPWLVTIALDGENCWEFYEQDGQEFFESLYQSLSYHPALKLVTVAEFIDQYPPRETLGYLHTGSWIDGSLTTWIGDPVKNQAWTYLAAARQMLAEHPEATEATNPAAWEALYAAEGSDWFWWFGEGHTSNQDAIFDQLFREHLVALYQALQEAPPKYLAFPLEPHAPSGTHNPQGLIHPLVDGQGDRQAWDKAGRIEIGGAQGVIHQASPVQRVWYGADHLHYYLRFDLQPGIPPDLHLCWFYPHQPLYNSPIDEPPLPDFPPLNYRFHHRLRIKFPQPELTLAVAEPENRWRKCPTTARAAWGECLEVAIPWGDLPVHPGWSLQLVVFLSQEGCFQSYLGEAGLIGVHVP